MFPPGIAQKDNDNVRVDFSSIGVLTVFDSMSDGSGVAR